MDELPGPSHREGTPPRRTRCRARMRDPEALQVGPGAVARLRSPILIKTSISFPSPGSAVYYLLWAGNSLRVLTIVKGLRRGGRSPEPAVHSDQNPIFRFYRSEEHTSELQSRGHLVCRLLLEKKKKIKNGNTYKEQ